jgi:D-glycero-D-manno-heptose 1,7-bisphosphate phosphatase
MPLSGKLKSAVFLDRDGVVNKAIVRNGLPYSPRQIEEFAILDGVKDAVTLLHKLDFQVVVVTNQPDVARAKLTYDTLEEFHRIIMEKIGIRHFYSCFHLDSDGCNCRKPKIGLFLRAAQDLSLDLKSSFLVGDRWKDIQAGQEVGCKCFFVEYNYAEKRPKPPFNTVFSLLEAAIMITGFKSDTRDI